MHECVHAADARGLARRRLFVVSLAAVVCIRASVSPILLVVASMLRRTLVAAVLALAVGCAVVDARQQPLEQEEQVMVSDRRRTGRR
jgi:hypothetical protein